MMGMEAMLASMLGVKPEEMKAMFTGLMDVANNAGETLASIDRKCDAILAQLERQNDGKG
jgi:hypothetical protein